MIKQLASRVLGDRTLGRLEFLLLPHVRNSLGGALNGQVFRRRMFQEILAAMQSAAIVETGTFRGSTTAYFAESGVPVYSVELHERHAGFAAMRLTRHRHRDRIRLFRGSSPEFLKALAKDPAFPRTKVFFYLDAHWYRHLPLAEELDIIFSSWDDAVVMIDDFQVPGTTYEYDNYGPGQALTPEYLARLPHLGLTSFFPSAPAEEETGLRRGAVVVCREPAAVQALSGLPSLASPERLAARAAQR